ncbi:2Fe-2S ferredoxin [Phytophthora megakarya]|uniref:2Fe-2S ferredoxin n=1 Tax=Phytophthora megakarya TaxID=4795 RepID=A0A225WQ40_9STRA|nr:2Fe-2S ferredoxin [Phytophthora megakarya]
MFVSRVSSALRHVTFTFVDGEGERSTVQAEEGQSLLDVAHENDVELEGACGGELACSTCHLVFEKRIFDDLPEISEEEEDMLDLAWGLTDTSRLGCQIPVTKAMEGMTVRIPDEADNLL